MTRSNPPSRPTRGAWRLLALAALGAAACGDSIASIEQTAGRAGPAEEPAGAAASSSSANSAAQLDTAAAQVVEGGLGDLASIRPPTCKATASFAIRSWSAT